MVNIILSILALLIIYFSFDLTVAGDKRKRIITGVVLMLSVLLYPLTITILLEISPSLNTTGALIIFHLTLLLTGIIIVIAGLFTKTKKSN